VTIPGGYILQPRCIDDSDIMHEPPVVRELWFYLLRRVNHTDQGKYKRGTGFFNLGEIQEALHWYSGYRKMKYSKPQLTKSLRKLRGRNMVETAKATHGIYITILNYSYYQDPKNYGGNSEGNAEETRRKQKGHTKNKNEKECKNEINTPPNPPKGESVIYPDWLNQKLWNEFKAHRRRIGKPMTPHAEKLNINKLEKFMEQGHQPDDLINMAIEKGWQGIYPPKNKGQGGSVLSFKQRHNAQVLHDFIENGGEDE